MDVHSVLISKFIIKHVWIGLFSSVDVYVQAASVVWID